MMLTWEGTAGDNEVIGLASRNPDASKAPGHPIGSVDEQALQVLCREPMLTSVLKSPALDSGGVKKRARTV
jgi:hypothetical protein